MTYTAAELAGKIGAFVQGDGGMRITGIAGVRDAGPGDIAFISQARYAADAEQTRAAALIVGEDFQRNSPAVLLRVKDPEAAFTQVAMLFAPPPVTPPPGIHPTALVAADVKLGRAVSIGPYCVIESGAVIGDRTVLFAGCYVGHRARIGADGRLYPHVTLREDVQIGDRVILHNGVVVGSDGFGYTVDAQGVRHKIPQIGTVIIGDDVEIGANTTIDRARFGKTRIGNGVKIDNLVQIAHNVIIGDHAVIVAQVGIAGSTMIGSRAVLAGQAGVAGHLVVGDGAIVGAQAGVTKDVPAGEFVSGYPAAPHKEAAKLHAHISRLPELKARVAELEKRLKELADKLR